MLGRRPARNLPNPIATGDCSPARGSDSPLERNPQSPKGWKKREADGVGLGILAKLDRTRSQGGVATAQIAIGPSWAAEVGFSGRRAYNSKPSADAGDFRVADFLSCCYLCRKKLHGKDIYMYRGEKAFCSMECRYKQIVSDECMEKYGCEVIRRPDRSSSPCSGGGRARLFFTEIVAA